MKPEKRKTPRQELEASLTALLLGELPVDKAAALRELMAKDAELARLYERLEQTIGMVRETAAPAEQGTQSAPKLSNKRREQLLAHFKTVAPTEFAKPTGRTIRARELAVAAGLVAFIGIAAWFTFHSTQQSFSLTSRISHGNERTSARMQFSGVPASAQQSPVASVSDQTTARLAAEQNLEGAQRRMVANTASADGGGSGGIGSLPQTIFDAPSAGKPIANQVVLPVVRDSDIYGNDYSLTIKPRKSSGPELSHEIAFENHSVQSASARATERPVTLSVSTNSAPIAGTAGDPQWLGTLERGNSSPAHSSTNAFVSQYAFTVAQTNQLDLTDIANRAYAPRVPQLVTNLTATNAPEFAYYSDLNRNGQLDPQGRFYDSTKSGSRSTGGFGSTGTGINYAKPSQITGALEQLDEMSRRQSEGLASTDNMHQKNSNVALAEDSGQQFRRKLLGIINNAANTPGEQAPAIDPATGLPLPAAPVVADNDGIAPATGLPIPAGAVEANGKMPTPVATASGQMPQRTLRLPAQTAAQTATPSTPMAGEKLAEVAQEARDASGSNIYLGRELAKADINFKTWGLDAGGLSHETKKEEKRLKQVGEVDDGVTAGSSNTPGFGFSLLGPKETQAGAPVPNIANVGDVPVLGDMPVVGALARGRPISSNLDVPTNAQVMAWSEVESGAMLSTNHINGHFYGFGAISQTNLVNAGDILLSDQGVAAAPVGAMAASSTNTTRIRDEAHLLDDDKEWVNPNSLGKTNASQSRAGTTSNVYSLDVVGYSGISHSGSNLPEQFGTEGNKETKLALNYGPVRDQANATTISGKNGDAVVSIDPDTRKTIIIADKETSQYIGQVVSNLDQNGKERRAVIRGDVAALQQKFADQQTKIDEARADVDRLRGRYNISNAMAAADAPTMLMSAEELRKLEGMRIELEAQVMKEETLLDSLKKMPREKLVASLPTAAPDTALNSWLEQKDLAEQSLIVKQRELGESNPEVAKLRGEVSDLNSKIDKLTDGILLNLDGRVSAVKGQLNTLRDEVEKAKTNEIADAQRTQPYWEAKRNLDNLQRFSQVLAMKIASENIEASLPKSTMVEIMDDAMPGKKTDIWDRIRGKGKFESQARIKVERDQSDISFMTDPKLAVNYDPYFIQNEFETIKSDKVLSNVVVALNLQKEWSKGGQTLSANEAIALLKQKLDLKPVRNTGFIDIEAKDDKPEEAAKLANAVAKSYRDYRWGIRKELSLGGIKALEDRLVEQEAKVREAQKQVDTLRAEAAINEAKAGASQPAANKQVDAAPPKPAVPPPVPQPEVQTRESAFSTFSLNVSDVAFKLAAASLEKGQMPEPAGIRSEEFINAFDYRDPEAPAGVPVAFAWERARYPYAQNRDLLRFSIKTAAQGRQAGRPLNLVLLLDNSGSMERADRVAIIREALKVLASQLQPQDKLSVITFARTAQLRVDGVSGSQAAQVAEDISGLTPEGGTNIEEAMNLAYQTALRHYLANGINRVVLLTDGAANLGNVEPESLKQKVEVNRKQGVALDCFGIGWEGFNDDLLETLSRNGDGRYGFINSPEEAATEFAGQLAGALNVAASDVKVQVEFDPARVTAYRQIGYAKHQLTKEQFRDNTVDAAEIAAQEAGNALYVIEVNPAGQGPLGTVRVRFKIPGTSDYREHEWSVPFNGNAIALGQASPAMRLAATASAFSEWLATSPYATEVTPDTLLSYLSGVPEVYGADARPKKLEWMIRQAKSIAGGEIRNSNIETRNSGEIQNSKSEARSKSEESKVQFP